MTHDNSLADADACALARHAADGLARTPKQLSSSWLYDAEGSRLFQQIMDLPEYYLTRVEHSILRDQAQAISACIAPGVAAVDLIELGSGDGAKTLTLLQKLMQRSAPVVYHPFDISAHAIAELSQRFASELPQLQLTPTIGDYFTHWPTPSDVNRQVAMFLGSNLGNFRQLEAVSFLQRIRSFLRPHDGLLLGVDLQKDPSIILAAYDDSQHITAAFNVNLLRRLNREIGTDFVLDQFHHYACYSPLDGAARSFLVSRTAQTVRCAQLALSVEFAAGECIYVEQSQKYTVPMIDELAAAGGFQREQIFFDAERWYAVVYLAAC